MVSFFKIAFAFLKKHANLNKCFGYVRANEKSWFCSVEGAFGSKRAFKRKLTFVSLINN